MGGLLIVQLYLLMGGYQNEGSAQVSEDFRSQLEVINASKDSLSVLSRKSV